MRFRRELKTRGAAPGTLRAYEGDLRELGVWATAEDREPGTLVYRDLRGFAASLSRRGLARASVARKLAAVRSFHDHLVRGRAAEQNPAELLPTPKAQSRLPRVLGPEEIARLLDRIPATTPLEVRDRALFEVAYSCGLRAEEIVSLDIGSVDFDAETLRVLGKGSKTRLVPVGEPAQRAIERYLERGRRRARGRAGRASALSLTTWPPALDLGCPAKAGPLGARSGHCRPHDSPHAATFFCDPSVGGGCRPEIDPGAARPLEHLDDTGLHEGRTRKTET